MGSSTKTGTDMELPEPTALCFLDEVVKALSMDVGTVNIASPTSAAVPAGPWRGAAL